MIVQKWVDNPAVPRRAVVDALVQQVQDEQFRHRLDHTALSAEIVRLHTIIRQQDADLRMANRRLNDCEERDE